MARIHKKRKRRELTAEFNGNLPLRIVAILFLFKRRKPSVNHSELTYTCHAKALKSTNPKKNTVSNPLELYTRQTATMEKYLGINEEEMNRELYTNVLQHLQDMMDESDRMKALENK